jgi:ribonuclease R
MFAFLAEQIKSRNPRRYPALVTDVRNFGFFVDVPDLAMSGLVPLSLVEDDFFMFDAARNRLVGRSSRRVIALGDTITVEAAKVDTFKKQVDFRMLRDKDTETKLRSSKDRTKAKAKMHHARPKQAMRRHQRRSSGPR